MHPVRVRVLLFTARYDDVGTRCPLVPIPDVAMFNNDDVVNRRYRTSRAHAARVNA